MTLPHKLPVEEVMRRGKTLITDALGKFGASVSGLRETWFDNGGSFSATVKYGTNFNVSGWMRVNQHSVELSVKLPLTARPFKGKIEAAIRTEAEKQLAS